MLSDFLHTAKFFSSLPGIGHASAYRIAFYLLKQPQKNIQHFADQLVKFHANIQYCVICGALKETMQKCVYCCSEERDKTILCVVEEPSDIYLIEETNIFRGIYHVIMGALSPIEGITPEDLRIKELIYRVKEESPIEEIILATNPTIEGNATAYYIIETLKQYKPNMRFSRISSGLAMGSKLDYADVHILADSIENRNIIHV